MSWIVNFTKLLPVLLLAAQASAGCADTSSNDASRLLRRDGTLSYLTCIIPCFRSASSSSRRDLDPQHAIFDLSAHNDTHDFEKRAWKMVNEESDQLVDDVPYDDHVDENGVAHFAYEIGEVSRYMYRQMRNMAGTYDNQFGGNIRSLASGNSEVAYSQYEEFGDTAFQLGYNDVYGCQVITVVSPTAVWMTHLWETYSMGWPGQDSIGDYTQMPPGDFRNAVQAWTERVIYFLLNIPVPFNTPTASPNYYLDPASYGQTWGGPDFTNRPYLQPAAGSELDKAKMGGKDDGSDIQVFFATPGHVENAVLVADYPNRATVTEDALRNALGANIRLVRLVYNRLDKNRGEQPSDIDSRGQYLFQYDPNADPNLDPKLPRARKQWRVFYESAYFWDRVL